MHLLTHGGPSAPPRSPTTPCSDMKVTSVTQQPNIGATVTFTPNGGIVVKPPTSSFTGKIMLTYK